MDNALTVVTPGTAALVLPADPDALHEAGGELGTQIRAYHRGVTVQATADTLRDAHALLAKLEPLCVPVDMRVVTLWLIDLAEMVAKSPADQGDLATRCLSLVEVCGHLPAGVWVKTTRIAYASANRWWPQPADLLAFLKPFAGSLARQRAGCLAIIAASKAAGEAASMGDHPYGRMTTEQRRTMGAACGQRIRQAIAEGAVESIFNRNVCAPTQKPITRTRMDDVAQAAMRRARSQNPAFGSEIRVACAASATEIEARLVGNRGPAGEKSA